MNEVSASSFILLLALLAGCADKSDVEYEPLPGPVILRPAFVEMSSFPVRHDPHIVIETQFVWPGCCSELVISQNASDNKGPVACRILGVQVQTYFQSSAPAVGSLLLPRIPFDYELQLSYDEFTDHYRVHIDESLLVVTPIERHFTILNDTLARTP